MIDGLFAQVTIRVTSPGVLLHVRVLDHSNNPDLQKYLWGCEEHRKVQVGVSNCLPVCRPSPSSINTVVLWTESCGFLVCFCEEKEDYPAGWVVDGGKGS
jgi:hypothetical protein